MTASNMEINHHYINTAKLKDAAAQMESVRFGAANSIIHIKHGADLRGETMTDEAVLAFIAKDMRRLAQKYRGYKGPKAQAHAQDYDAIADIAERFA